MLHNQLISISEYNVWANSKIMNLILKAGETIADAETGGSFNTIRKTLYHIYDAETIWLHRLNGQTLEYWPPSRDFDFTLKHFSPLFIERSLQLETYVKQLAESQLNEPCIYHTTTGIKYQTLVKDILTHVFNHSTYHRGQLINMLRMLNAPATESTDYIIFCRELLR